jgi:hypothetical protein
MVNSTEPGNLSAPAWVPLRNVNGYGCLEPVVLFGSTLPYDRLRGERWIPVPLPPPRLKMLI